MSRTIPHTIPLAEAEFSADQIAIWKLVRLHPRPEARAAGMRAYDADEPRTANCYPVGTPEHANWDAGWAQRLNEEF